MKRTKSSFKSQFRWIVLAGLFFGLAEKHVIAQYKSPAGSLNFGLATYQGLSFLEGAQFTGIKPAYSHSTGLSLKYYETITIGLQLDLLYSKAGGTFSKMERLSNQSNVKVETTQKLNFISVPLSINFYLSDRYESENVHFKLGIIPSFLINAIKKSNNPEDAAEEMSNAEEFRTMDFGFMAGVGIELRRFNIVGEYYLGVKNLNSDPNGARITNHGPKIGVNYFLKRWD